MKKIIRNAVKCYVIDANKVLITKYNSNNKKANYYDIPGGKIEQGETAIQTAIREVREETSLIVDNLKNKGLMIVEYPDRIYNFDVFVTNSYQGIPRNFEENTSEWIEIDELLKKEKLLSNIILLDKYFIKSLKDTCCNFKIHINVTEDEQIVKIEYVYNND